VSRIGLPAALARQPSASSNNSFKPNLLRYTNNVACKACHVVGSATQVGLTQALGVVWRRVLHRLASFGHIAGAQS